MKIYRNQNMDKTGCAVQVVLIVLCCMLGSGCLQQGETGEGILEGKVTIGPICPVEQPGVTCEPPPEAYAARKVVVYGEDGRTILKIVDINSTGYYSAMLKVGTYVVDINHLGIDRSGDVPKTVTVAAGKTVTLDIAIDTGIR